MMDIETARSLLMSELTPVRDKEQVSLCRAVGRVLAEDIRAPFAVPHFPKSAMDGYAVRSAEVQGATPEQPVRLTVVGEVLAGDDPAECLRFTEESVQSGDAGKAQGSGQPGDAGKVQGSGQPGDAGKVQGSLPTAVRIMTGAAVPEDYDAVVRQEDTDYGEEVVSVYRSVAAYTNYCKAGEDVEKDSVVLTAGQRIGRIEAGILASLGISQVTVVRPVRVTILSTGSELCDPVSPEQPAESLEGSETPGQETSDIAGAAPPVGKIYSSIAVTLTAGLPEAGFTVESLIVPDEADQILQALEQALQMADVVITTGGVSVGKKDLLPEVLERLGARQVFARVDVQPGTPTIGSVKNRKAILSLSGNPYAALVNFDLYFWDMAAKLTGCSAYLPVWEEAELASEYPKKNQHRRLIRARVSRGQVMLPAKSHAASVLSNLMECNCYIDLPAGQQVSVGDRVRILRMPTG